MKLIIRQYLAGLRERNELDAVLPGLLTEMGLNVYSRPGRGTRQDGVDVAAVGSIDSGPEKLYLFAMKSGDLTRKEWDGEAIQSLRPTLNEILDAYIRNRIPPEHKDKQIVICITFGGDVQEQVRPALVAFMESNSKEGKITFEEWNGDKLASLIQTHFLREDLIAESVRSDLRKTLAMLDDPETAYEYFAALVRALSKASSNDEERVRSMRQLSVCLWILFSWSRDIQNLECAYRASELTLLHAWHIYRTFEGKKSKASEAGGIAFASIFQAYRQIASSYIGKMVPHLAQQHALSAAVQGGSPVDANLKMFDLLGRLATGALWSYSSLAETTEDATRKVLLDELRGGAAAIRLLISNNPTLYSPMKDDQAIEIALAALVLLISDDDRKFLREWFMQMTERIRLAFVTSERYPSIIQTYSELLDHPLSKDAEYLESVTSASILYPVLAHIAAILKDETLYAAISGIQAEFLAHSNFQLWFPDDASEDNLYTDQDLHGIACTDIKLQDGSAVFLQRIAEECSQYPQFGTLSCVKNSWWPLVLIACRHFRLPVPPQLLQAYAQMEESSPSAPVDESSESETAAQQGPEREGVLSINARNDDGLLAVTKKI